MLRQESHIPREPTADECTNNARTEDGIAIWYPSMGGYVSKCILLFPDKNDEAPCTDIYVWHDGSFPFSDGGPHDECWCYCGECPCCDPERKDHPRNPVRLHHCLIGDFETFGQKAEKLLDDYCNQP